MAKSKKKQSRRKQKKQSLPQQQPALTKAQLDSRSEDSGLIHAAIKGNQEAYKRLMKKYYTSLSHLIYKLVHDREEVEDLTQEAFIKAFASLKNFNEEYAFSTWLFKIATNNAIDYLRKKKLEAFSINKPLESEDSDYMFELPDSTYEPDKDVIGKQRAAFIEEAISSLPEKYRKVILLRHKEERDYSEIAKILKLPIGTVKAHIFRARELLYKKLRTQMAQY
ncbi:MAG: sigma-70 family RNA polymerase sigma factor [Bacteroidetes bacterium]|nr:MAG: sigma-70 family RNA polymerase sigma factor [Bacteroidota bacterium]